MGLPKYTPNYTHADYLQWEGSWELWNGVAVAMTPSPFGPHQRLVARLARRFLDALERAGCEDCEVYCELDWVVSDNTVVRPDVSIVCGAKVPKFIEHPPALIVEVVSNSTAEKDRTSKKDLYEIQGVLYYLIIDPQDLTRTAFKLSDSKFVELDAQSPLAISLHAGCSFELNTAEL